MNKLITSGAVLLAFTGTAVADDLDGDGLDDITGEAVLTTTDDSSSSDASSTDAPEPAPASASADGPQMGIATSFNGVTRSPVLQFLYNLGGNYLDVFSGFAFENVSPEMGDSSTVIGLQLGAGYRMYKDMDGRIHPYLEPYLAFTLVNDSAEMGDDSIRVEAGAMLGVDFMVYDQFSLGAALGAALAYDSVSDVQSTFSIFTYTTSINATFWWGK